MVVSTLAGNVEESTLEDQQVGGNGNRIKIFDFQSPDLARHLAIVILHHVECELEQVTILSLQEEEESTSHLVHHARDDLALALWVLCRARTARDRNSECILVGMAVGDIVFRTHQNTTGTIRASGYLEQHACRPVNGIRPLPDDVVQTQIKFVVHQRLFSLFVCLARRVLVTLAVIHFKSSEDGVFIPDIQRHHRKD